MNPEANKCPRCNAAMGDLDPTHYKIIDNLCEDCCRSEKTTNTCPHCGALPTHLVWSWKCGSYQFPHSLPLKQSSICREREANNKTRLELSELKARRPESMAIEYLRDCLNGAEAQNQKLRQEVEELTNQLNSIPNT